MSDPFNVNARCIDLANLPHRAGHVANEVAKMLRRSRDRGKVVVGSGGMLLPGSFIAPAPLGPAAARIGTDEQVNAGKE